MAELGMELLQCLVWALKALGVIFIFLLALGLALMVFVIVREALWVVKYENRKKYLDDNEQEGEE